ncbi:autotransporter outer membrane beta-barrel domain-containing protein [Pseudomonas pergaminensis]
MAIKKKILQCSGVAWIFVMSQDVIALSVNGPDPISFNGPFSPIIGNGLNVGTYEYGRVNIINGAKVTSHSVGVGSGQLGVDAGSEGVVVVSGSGSQWNSTGETKVGVSGKGLLVVDDAALVSVGESLSVGVEGNSIGSVVVSNGSSISIEKELNVGGQDSSQGSVSVIGGSIINVGGTGVGSITLGTGSNSVGELLVSGDGSTVNATGVTVVGKGGVGMLTLQNKGQLTTDKLVLADIAGSIGVLYVGSSDINAPSEAGLLNATEGVWLGDGDGGIVFNHITSDYEFAAAIKGDGSVLVANGRTIFTGESTYSGLTTVAGGVLEAGGVNVFSENSDYTVFKDGALSLNGYSQTLGGLTNSGVVSLQGDRAGAVLTINGDYIGGNGLLIFNSVLDGDASVTDRLVILGDTSGLTKVSVNNLGGSGASTLNGIELITVQGNSLGQFEQSGRIVAGAYDYRLVRGEGSNSGNWYLDSGTSKVPEIPESQTIRPEAASYSANLAMANALFETSLEDRPGSRDYIDPLSGEKKTTSLWMKTIKGYAEGVDVSGQLSTSSDRHFVMIGSDFASGATGKGGGWRAGALVGYGSGTSDTSSRLTSYDSKGRVSGYSIGVYSTWYDDAVDKMGTYVDSVLQYRWFDNSVKGEGLSGEQYKSRGPFASVEIGHVMEVSKFSGFSVDVQPKVKVAWSNIKAKDHIERNGTVVKFINGSGVSTSLGVRALLKNNNRGSSVRTEIKPYVEAGWIHNDRVYGVNMDRVKISQDGYRDVGEIKLGVEGEVTSRLSLSGAISNRFGGRNYSDSVAELSLTYGF